MLYFIISKTYNRKRINGFNIYFLTVRYKEDNIIDM
jgi:hypothetical protein